MLTKEISEVEKEIERVKEWLSCKDIPLKTDNELDNFRFNERYLLQEEAKLSILKSAQAKFDKFKQEELEFLKLLNSVDNNKIGQLIDQRITLFLHSQQNEKAILEASESISNKRDGSSADTLLKYYQAKFNKFVEDLKLDIKRMSPTHEVSKEMLLKRIDELSSKQEGTK
jgi:hypothetical protein